MSKTPSVSESRKSIQTEFTAAAIQRIECEGASMAGQKKGESKPNQDRLTIIRDFLNDYVLCLVADGHGIEGSIVSEQLRKKFPMILETEIRKEILSQWKEGEPPVQISNHLQKIKDCFKQAFLEANKQIQKLKAVVQLSGSTLTVIMIDGDFLFCANVGDSRAIVMKQQRSNVKS